MREILFRGKSNDNREWVYGDLRQYITLPYGFENFYCIDTMPVSDGFGSSYSIMSETIGQYTGLCDKNGKKIFEGDIVKVTYIEKRDYLGVKYDNLMTFNELVVYKNCAFMFEIDNDGIKMYRDIDFNKDINSIKIKELEVLGNVFDNPELLQEEY